MSTPTIHTLTARAMFGLVGDAEPPPAPRLAGAASDLAAALGRGCIALITGPSGAGKSSLAAAIISHCKARSIAAIPAAPDVVDPREGVTPIDLLTGPLAGRLRLLASVGLADARVFVRPARALSAGERARLGIALALDRVRAMGESMPAPGREPILILDEFASTLDRPAAARLARLLRRRVARASSGTQAFRVICLTAHEDLAAPLSPDLHIRVSPGPRLARVQPVVRVAPTSVPASALSSSAAPSDRVPLLDEAHVVYRPGTYADYAALACHHYRAARPAMLAGPGAIRRAIDARTGATIGVLVVAMPTLNASWRAAAWPGWFNSGDKRLDAARLSRDLRTIARVIVAPSHRALGIASELVRRYLADPLTPATEAVAAMGYACPFFEAAGMAAYRLPPTARDARLLDALLHLGISPASLIATTQHPLRARTPRPSSDLLHRELRLWANRSRCTRHLVNDPAAIAARAGAALLARPIAYAHVATAIALATTRTTQSEGNAHAPIRHAA